MWIAPSLLFFFAFFSSTFLYAYNISNLPFYLPNFAYDNFDLALKFAFFANIALFIGYTFKISKSVSYSRPVILEKQNLSKLNILKLNLFFLVVILLYTYFQIVSILAGVVPGADSYLDDTQIGIFYRVNFIVSHILPSLTFFMVINFNTSEHKTKFLKYLLYISSSVIILFTLLSFNRQAAVQLIIYLSMYIHFRVRSLKSRNIFVVFLALLILQLFRSARELGPFISTDLSDLVKNIQTDNIIASLLALFTGIAGWDVYTNLFDLVPVMDNFKFGKTYLDSFLQLFLPRSLGLGSYNAITPSRWYRDIYSPGTTSHGFDFSMLAESYLNFGFYFPIFFLLIGVLLRKINDTIIYTNKPNNLFFSIVVLIALTFGLRGDSNSMFKSMVYLTIPILIINRVLKSKKRESLNY